MYKSFLDALDKAGIVLPRWFFIVVAGIFTLLLIWYLFKKYIIPTLKKINDVYNDVKSIKDIRETQVESIKKSIDGDKTLQDQITGMNNCLDKIMNTLDEINNGMTKQHISQQAQSTALKVILASELDKKYRYYLEIGYIPDKEFDEYVDMHDSYKGLGGNHHGDEKFEYIMSHLERKVI